MPGTISSIHSGQLSLNTSSSKSFSEGQTRKIAQIQRSRFSYPDKLSEDLRAEKIIWAARICRPEDIVQLLAEGSISHQDKLSAICNALRSKEPQPQLQALSFSDKGRGAWVKAAVLYNRPEDAKILLETGSISDKDRADAMKYAIQQKTEKTANILLKSGCISNDARNELEQIVKISHPVGSSKIDEDTDCNCLLQ